MQKALNYNGLRVSDLCIESEHQQCDKQDILIYIKNVNGGKDFDLSARLADNSIFKINTKDLESIRVPATTTSNETAYFDYVLKDKNAHKPIHSAVSEIFIDKNTLVITTNENIFTAIVGKDLISKQTQ